MGFFEGAAGSILGAGLGAISSAASAKQQYKYNLKLQQQAQQYNTSEREAAQAYNTDMWNAQNAYNDPSAQRQRLEAAGYNPYYNAADAGTASSVPASQGATSSANSVGMPNTGQIVSSAFSDMANFLYNKKKIESETNRNNAAANESNSQSGVNDAMKNRYEKLTPLEAANLGVTIDNIRQQTETNKQLAELYTAQKIGQTLGNKYQETVNKYADEKQRLGLEQLAAQIAQIGSQTELNYASVKKVLAERIYMLASANQANASAENIRKDTEYLTGTLVNSIKATNAENMLRGSVAANEYRAEKIARGTARAHQAKAELYQAQTASHLAKGERGAKMAFQPGTSYWTYGTLNTLDEYGKQAIGILPYWFMTRGRGSARPVGFIK